jgi:hypothetical protein
MKLGEWVDRRITKKALKRDLSIETDLNREYDLKNLISKNKQFNTKSKKLYLFISGWYETPESTRYLKKQIIKKGNSYVQYLFRPWILTSNYKQTIKNFKHIQKEIERDISNFNGDVICIGTSLGGIAAVRISNKNNKIKKLINLAPTDSLAESVWQGIRTQNLRKSFEKQGINLKKLKVLWKELEPINNLNNFEGKEIYIGDSKCDTISSYGRSFKFVKELQKRGINFKLNTNSWLGHYGTIAKFYLPFNKHMN